MVVSVVVQIAHLAIQFMISDLGHKLKLKSFRIYVIIFLATGFPIFAQSADSNYKNCDTTDDYSTKIVIIGDSFFTTNKGKLGSLEYLSKLIEGACVENLANSGAGSLDLITTAYKSKSQKCQNSW